MIRYVLISLIVFHILGTECVGGRQMVLVSGRQSQSNYQRSDTDSNTLHLVSSNTQKDSDTSGGGDGLDQQTKIIIIAVVCSLFALLLIGLIIIGIIYVCKARRENDSGNTQRVVHVHEPPAPAYSAPSGVANPVSINIDTGGGGAKN